jgi:hypothetical protein
MSQRRFVAIAGAIAIAIVGCSSDQSTTTTSSPSPVASSPAAAPTQSPVAAQPFAKPLVAQKNTTPNAVSGLIQPTNGDERAKQVQATINADRARKDPFSSLPPVLIKPASPQKAQAGSQLAQVPSISGRVPTLPTAPQPGSLPTLTATGNRPPGPSSPFPPSRSGNAPSRGGRTPSSATNAPAAIPTPPSTTLASGVEVSGVVYVGGVAQAIIKAPNEQTSRYVRVGQRLSDGQVLVKRIEMNSGSEPIVVLEQNGVEIPKAVGEQAPTTGKPA